MTNSEPTNAADSAGVPWAGRTLTSQPFAADDGTADAALARALAAGDLEQTTIALLTARNHAKDLA